MNFDKCRSSATEDLSTISGGSCVVKAKVDFEEGEAKMMDDSGYAHALIAASSYTVQTSLALARTRASLSMPFFS